MAETTISWTHTVDRLMRPVPGYTFNPWIGCTRIAPACDFCYAADYAARYNIVEWGEPGKGNGTRKRTMPANWKKPFQWNRKAEAEGNQPFVFCASLADVFDNAVDPAWRRDLFDLIRATPHLVWLLLTKRPQNIEAMIEACGETPMNIALGTTCEDQKRWDQNVPHLVAASAALGAMFNFVSIEPMLGPIDPTSAPIIGGMKRYFPAGHTHFDPIYARAAPWLRVNWLIVGGESGQHARPMHPKWAEDIERKCRHTISMFDTGTAFHFKQWGEWAPPDRDDVYNTAKGRAGKPPAFIVAQDGTVHTHRETAGEGAAVMIRKMKHKAGRSLLGKEHLGYPRDMVRAA